MLTLTNEELKLIADLLASAKVDDPANRGCFLYASELPYAQVLTAKLMQEQKLRREEIPQDWREQADEFIARKGVYVCPPAKGGGTFIKEPQHVGKFVAQIDDADQLLALLDLGEFTEAEEPS